MNNQVITKVKNYLLPTLINQFNLEDYQCEQDLINFFDMFFSQYQLSRDEITYLLCIFQFWLKEQS
jgi:hypothetical protein